MVASGRIEERLLIVQGGSDEERPSAASNGPAISTRSMAHSRAGSDRPRDFVQGCCTCARVMCEAFGKFAPIVLMVHFEEQHVTQLVTIAQREGVEIVGRDRHDASRWHGDNQP